MKPQPIHVRVLHALRLQPMTSDQIARCLSCTRGAVNHNLENLAASGDVVRSPRPRMHRIGRRPFVYSAAA